MGDSHTPLEMVPRCLLINMGDYTTLNPSPEGKSKNTTTDFTDNPKPNPLPPLKLFFSSEEGAISGWELSSSSVLVGEAGDTILGPSPAQVFHPIQVAGLLPAVVHTPWAP